MLSNVSNLWTEILILSSMDCDLKKKVIWAICAVSLVPSIIQALLCKRSKLEIDPTTLSYLHRAIAKLSTKMADNEAKFAPFEVSLAEIIEGHPRYAHPSIF